LPVKNDEKPVDKQDDEPTDRWKGIHNVEFVGDRNNRPYWQEMNWDNVVKAFEGVWDD
jgi:hypothetical protein